MATALLAGDCSIILVHNHSAGTMKPSDGDVQLTKQIKEGGKTLNIGILDHLIISGIEERYYSFSDENLL